MVSCDPAMAWTIRLNLALLFAEAARHKWRARSEFVGSIASYRVAPAWAVGSLAWAVLASESAVALALVVIPGRHGAIGAALLLLAYAGAMAINLKRGRRDLDCGCGGRSEAISETLVVRNLLLAGGAGMTLLPSSGRALVWVDAATIAGGVAVAASLYLAAETARFNASRLRPLARA